MPQNELLTCYVGAVKALGDGRVRGPVVLYGDPKQTDLVGDFFTKDTDFGINERLPVYFQHGMDVVLGNKRLSIATLSEAKDGEAFGLWAEYQLDLEDQYQQFLYERAAEGKMGHSSGAVGHLVTSERQPNQTHEITAWPLGEVSLTPEPMEPRMVGKVVPLKSLTIAETFPTNTKAETITVPVEIDITVKQTPQPNASEADMAEPTNDQAQPDAAPVTLDAIKALLEGERANTQAMIDEAAKAFTPVPDDVPDDVQAGAPAIAKMSNLWKYDNYEDADLAFSYEVLKAAGKKGITSPSENLAKAIGCRVIDHAEKDRTYRPVLGAMKKAGVAIKADELNQSTLSGFGDEWVGVTYSRDVWERVVDGSQVVQSTLR